MAYTAYQLITRAYYLSQIVSRGLQTVQGYQAEDGLLLLNELIDVKGSDLRLIPYFTELDFNTVPGQEMYYIPNCLQIDSLTFNIGVVRYPMKEKTRREYFATGRVDNITNLPWAYRQERCLGGTNLYLYFLPGGVYQLRAWIKFGLTDVTLEQDLSLTYDLYYLEYLRYALAEYICHFYGNTLPEATAMKLAEIRKKLLDISPADLSIRKRSYFNVDHGVDWQFVNIGVGYIP